MTTEGTSYKHKIFREPAQGKKLLPPDMDEGEAIYLDAQPTQAEQRWPQPPLGTKYSSEQSP